MTFWQGATLFSPAWFVGSLLFGGSYISKLFREKVAPVSSYVLLSVDSVVTIGILSILLFMV